MGDARCRGGSPVEILPVAAGDVEPLVALAREIWYVHYPGIIRGAQIEYMLAQRYDAALVRAELGREGVWWDKLVVGAEMAGFASYFLTGAPGEMKLDKLYVHPRYQRRGYGAQLIERAAGRARMCGCVRLALSVNRNNHTAIAAYLKHGFRIAGTAVTDIGGGFVMDDYVMEKPVTEEPPASKET
jgi:ribosomal protein S18 acetylase RimI-like enzyme